MRILFLTLTILISLAVSAQDDGNNEISKYTVEAYVGEITDTVYLNSILCSSDGRLTPELTDEEILDLNIETEPVVCKLVTFSSDSECVKKYKKELKEEMFISCWQRF